MDNPLVQPDPGLFIWTIVTFLVLLTLLAKFAWKPLLEALETRQQGIRKALDDAQAAKQELQRLEQDAAQMMRKARAEAEVLITQSRADADRLREEAGVIVLPGSGFGAGGEGFFRISFIQSESRIAEAAKRAGAVLNAMLKELA